MEIFKILNIVREFLKKFFNGHADTHAHAETSFTRLCLFLEHWVGKAHLVMKGHRSLVNQVRYNSHTEVLISSGVEKIIKVCTNYGGFFGLLYL